METTFLLISHQVLESSTFLKSTVAIWTDGFVFLFPILLIILFLRGWKVSQHPKTKDQGLKTVYLSLTLFLNTILVFLTNYIIKFFIERPRPYETLDLPVPTEELALSSIPIDSFPSDHAAVSMTIAATLLFRGYRTKNRGIQLLGRGFLIIALIMGRGRIAIAIHWPTDILAGFTIGIIIALITTRTGVQKKLQPVWDYMIKIWNRIIIWFSR